MTNERLKMWIDLGKWSIVSVGLVLMTKIVDNGFKDREVGLKEITTYDRYTKLITDYNRIAERRMLAQFFANVSPSDEIRKGWQRYYEEVNKEYLAHLESLNAKEKQLQELQNSNSKTSKINTQAIEKLNKEIESMTEILMIRESVKQRLESAEEAL
jgi:septal ring factor EnvC (AmiA/AmiB activator)